MWANNIERNGCALVGVILQDILLSISISDKKGNEGNKELSDYFLVEILLVIDLVKKYYLKVKYYSTQLLHSQYNPLEA